MKTKAFIWGLRIPNSRYTVLGSNPNIVSLGSEALGFLRLYMLFTKAVYKRERLYMLFTKNFDCSR